jgi:putative membrane protein
MILSDGFLADHMAVHIVAMNVVAPLGALVWRTAFGRAAHSAAASVVPAALAQLALIWGWHLPTTLAFALASPAAMAAMHVSLLAAALWFWRAVIDATDATDMRAIGAVLVTGKLFCLLGILLAFAPRPIYLAAAGAHAGHAAPESLLADQQLAGLLMLIACPLTYVLAGIVIAARWLGQIERSPSWTEREGFV